MSSINYHYSALSPPSVGESEWTGLSFTKNKPQDWFVNISSTQTKAHNPLKTALDPRQGHNPPVENHWSKTLHLRLIILILFQHLLNGLNKLLKVPMKNTNGLLFTFAFKKVWFLMQIRLNTTNCSFQVVLLDKPHKTTESQSDFSVADIYLFI